MESATFSSKVRGIKFYDGYALVEEGRRVVCEWERGNPRDANAVAVFAIDGDGRVMAGHLEKAVAAIVGPFLRYGKVKTCAGLVNPY